MQQSYINKDNAIEIIKRSFQPDEIVREGFDSVSTGFYQCVFKKDGRFTTFSMYDDGSIDMYFRGHGNYEGFDDATIMHGYGGNGKNKVQYMTSKKMPVVFYITMVRDSERRIYRYKSHHDMNNSSPDESLRVRKTALKGFWRMGFDLDDMAKCLKVNLSAHEKIEWKKEWGK